MQDVEAFAAALQRVRRQAGLTYRELAGKAAPLVDAEGFVTPPAPPGTFRS